MAVSVLFVCLGNICRSPMAEGIFRKLVNDQGKQNHFHIDSCGTASYHVGELPDIRARKCCKKHQIELTHRARSFTENDLLSFDHIIVMDRFNYKMIKNCAKSENLKKIKFFGESQDCIVEIPDPNYGNEDGFEETFKLLHVQAAELLKHLCNLYAV